MQSPCVPEEILFVQGTQLISDWMKEVWRLLGVTQSTTAPYHPMCNGLESSKADIEEAVQ